MPGAAASNSRLPSTIAKTAAIRYAPAAITAPVLGNISFLTTIPICWLCIAAARRHAKLAPHQLVPGTAYVVALCTLIDACALRWLPQIYTPNADPTLFRPASAWLLWGYGTSLAIALYLAGKNKMQQKAKC